MSLLLVLVVLGLRQSQAVREPALLFSALLGRWRDVCLLRSARPGGSAWPALLLLLALPTLLVAVPVLALQEVWYELPLQLFTGLVLMLVLLDRRWPQSVQREQDMWAETDREHAALLQQTEAAVVAEAMQAEFARARQGLVEEQLRELFAPLFWFLCLGPVALTLYYFLRLAAAQDGEAGHSAAAQKARELLFYADWPVARTLGLSFALAGDFVAGWQYWRKQVLAPGLGAGVFLEGAAAAAQPLALTLGAGQMPGATMAQALTVVAALLQRTLVVWVVLLALHILWP